MSVKAGKPKLPLLTLYLRGLQSHSPSEKDAIFAAMAPHVVIDELAEQGWRMIREGLALSLPVLSDILTKELPGVGSGISLRQWYDMCINKCLETRRQRGVAAAGDLCLTCLYVAIVARRVATRPRAAVPV